jgi:hypothetical protein
MAPTASAPRLYVETLNEMIDAETVRVAALSNRVPTAVLVLAVLGSALALGLLGPIWRSPEGACSRSRSRPRSSRSCSSSPPTSTARRGE